MNTTHVSLLVRVRDSHDRAARDLFAAIYAPIIKEYCAERWCLTPDDREDVAQAVLLKVLEEMPTFSYDPLKRSFRGWLHRVTMNQINDRGRRQKRAKEGADRLREQIGGRGTERTADLRSRDSDRRAARDGVEGVPPVPSAAVAREEDEDQAWFVIFQTRLFWAAVDALRGDGQLSDQELRIIALWWADRKEGPRQAARELRLTVGREACLRSRALKRVKEQLLILSGDEPMLELL